jgi:hypothetical protein
MIMPVRATVPSFGLNSMMGNEPASPGTYLCVLYAYIYEDASTEDHGVIWAG